MNPIFLGKELIAASSTGIGTISSGQSSAASLNSSHLDTQRRITVWASSNGVTSASIIIHGTQQGGGAIYEYLTGPSSTTPSVTIQDYLTVTSVTASSALQSEVFIGTNTQGSTPWQSVNVHITPVTIGAFMHFSSTANGMKGSIECTIDNVYTVDSPYFPGGFQPHSRLTIGATAPPFRVFTSSAFSSATGDNWDAINVTGALSGNILPIYAWRLLLTSSSSSAGRIDVHSIQSGIGV